IMETQLTEEVKKIGEQSDLLYRRLTADRSENVSSLKIQSIVHEIFQFMQKNSMSISSDTSFINMLIETYSNDAIKSMTDAKYGTGASDYIVKAFRYYLAHHSPQNNQSQQA
ncbi:MAG: TipAS antibiotic-recognition domain-containing protein, partial [Eubacterium sp.]|nr:TipAS antibiotic-recognition domain-containing protein [Eubacterium sp.]